MLRTGIKRLFLCVVLAIIVIIAAFPSLAKERRVVRVGYPIQSGFSMKKEDGSYYGYTYDYLKELAQYTGWDYEFVEVEGNLDTIFLQLLAMLESGEIDLLGGMSYLESMKDIYNYSGNSYGNTYLTLGVLQQSDLTPADFTELPILRVAVVGEGGRQQSSLEEYLESIGQDYQLLPCKDGVEQDEKLKSGDADAALITDVALSSNWRPVNAFSPTPFYFAVTKEKKELLKELNAGMMELSENHPELISKLYREYFGRSAERIIFTEEEKEYLERHNKLKVLVYTGKAPIQSLDPETGQPVGISISLLEQISQDTGLAWEYLCTEDVQEFIKLLEDGTADLAVGIPFTENIEKSFPLWRTLPYLNVSQALIFRKGVNPEKLEGKTEALFDPFGEADVRAGKSIRFQTAEEAMEAVDSGKADYCLINNYSYQYCINGKTYKNISAVSVNQEAESSLCIGLADRSDLTLHSILNKALINLSDKEREDIIYRNSIWQERSALTRLIRENPLLIAVLLAGMALLLLGAAARLILGRYEMNRKMALEYDKYRQLAEIVGERIYEYDYRTDTLQFAPDGVKTLGVPEQVKNFTVSGERLKKEGGRTGENSLFQWTLDKREGSGEVQLMMASDPNRWYHINTKLVKDAQGVPVYALGRIRDIHQEKQEKEKLLSRAQLDGMTGIYNAITVREQISEALKHDQPGGQLLILDVDYFKEINDHYGHAAGDSVLAQIGRSMKEVFGDNIYGRLGGDEFIVFIRPGKEEESAVWAKRLREKMKKIAVSDNRIGIQISIGIARRAAETEFEELYRRADDLLYETKRNGRDGYRSEL